ncbi:hypothetical protein N0V86_002367 [Didymella sp. IMI 355093]|nr:hypothetical protein N0V86_002367 [Didymella sp. IMI 355093]
MEFEYDQLSSNTSKRLLRVLPEQDDHQIRIELWQPREVVPYRCLSYTRGSSDAFSPILINGQRKAIGKDLHEFLEVASRRFAGETFWVDAICINQDDDGEMSTQIQGMRATYQEATEVVVWLGNHELIAGLFDWIQECEEISGWKRFASHMSFDKALDRLQDSIAALLHHPVWSQTWVGPELALAPSLRLLCRASETTPTNLRSWARGPLTNAPARKSKLLSSLFRLAGKIRGPRPSFALNRISSLLERSQSKEALDFWDVLDPWSICADPRDRISAALTLTSHTSFSISYSESPLSIFHRTASFFSAWYSTRLIFHLLTALNLNLQSPTLRADLARPELRELRCTIPLRVSNLTAFSVAGRKEYCSIPRVSNVEIPLSAQLGIWNEPGVVLCPWRDGLGGGVYDGDWEIGHRGLTHWIVYRGDDTADGEDVVVKSYNPGVANENKRLRTCPAGTRLHRVVDGVETHVAAWADITREMPDGSGGVSGSEKGQEYVLYLPFVDFMAWYLLPPQTQE